jgi:hypothetical protein
MKDDIGASGDGVWAESEDEFWRIEDGGGGVSEEWHAGVFFGFPERPATGVPLGLNAQVEGIVVVRGIAIRKLPALEKDRPVACHE